MIPLSKEIEKSYKDLPLLKLIDKSAEMVAKDDKENNMNMVERFKFRHYFCLMEKDIDSFEKGGKLYFERY